MNGERSRVRTGKTMGRSPSGLDALPEVSSAPPSRAAAALFLATAAIWAVSMPLGWHHALSSGPGYRLVRGIDGASWLVVAAGVCTVLAVYLALRAAGTVAKGLVAALTFSCWLGMWTDYENWEIRAATEGIPAYFGPGFYVALAGATVLAAAAVQAWRSGR